MGTRADFYVGKGKDAEWIGSIAWDGYPSGIEPGVFATTNEADFRARVLANHKDRDDWTAPDRGWPWPWNDSRTTDYAYLFVDGKVWASRGDSLFDPTNEPDDEPESETPLEWPDMSARKAVTLGSRSGLIVIGPRGPESPR